MLRRRTLFVVGAGASKEFGLPTGKDLALKISDTVDIRFEHGFRPIGKGDLDLYRQLSNGGQRDGYQIAGWRIRDGIHLARSIDDFLDLHKGDPFVVEYGKAAIVKSVLEAEHESRLYFNRWGGEKFHPGNFADTWLVKLMQMLAPGIPVENAHEIFDNISFIIFNYDRCVEFFFLHALQQLYGLSEDAAGVICDKLDITHPYGVIDPSVEFGANQANYPVLAKGIKIYIEQISDAALMATLADKIIRARHIVFLGFAYHDLNMRLLTPPEKMPNNKFARDEARRITANIAKLPELLRKS